LADEGAAIFHDFHSYRHRRLIIQTSFIYNRTWVILSLCWRV
jgi:hypothetical protein